MPLNVRSIAIKIAVMCFFAVSVIGSVSGASPFTCCKRALAGAVVAYIAGSLAVKAVNAIIISTIITQQFNKQKGTGNDNKD